MKQGMLGGFKNRKFALPLSSKIESNFKNMITHTNALGDDSGNFTVLPTFYKKYGYSFNQVKRVGDAAIYSQESDGKIYAYEVFEIRKQKAGELFGKILEAKEKVPSSENWGVNAYTVFTMQEAEKRLSEILQKIEERKKNSEHQ